MDDGRYRWRGRDVTGAVLAAIAASGTTAGAVVAAVVWDYGAAVAVPTFFVTVAAVTGVAAEVAFRTFNRRR